MIASKIKPIKVIYNPHAGAKRHIISKDVITLEDIKSLFERYQIPAKFYPTKYPGHATELAKDAVREKFGTVIAAGGDGTVDMVATALVGTDINVGVLPLGTFMNVAVMLSIPFDIEKAVLLIKIGRTRKIDVAQIISLDGQKLEKPRYFIENAGIGLEAELQKHSSELEKGNVKAIFQITQTLREYWYRKVKINLDGEIIEKHATLVEVSNGPMSATALHLAPQAKLNDHRLTVSLFHMTKFELARYFFKMKREGKVGSAKIERFYAKKVKIETKRPRAVHADATIFGTTPVEFRIIPNALNVITGFPEDSKAGLSKRTVLDP